MKKIIVAPGAFKHSIPVLSAVEAIMAGLRESGLPAELCAIPIADGGNGTLDAFLAHGGERRTLAVTDPLGRPVEAAYGLIDDGTTAVIEMALASGLELLRDDERDPLQALTAGTGQLMLSALESGVRRVIVGMGGSATVDGGVGALMALGVRFLDATGEAIHPHPATLESIHMIDPSALDPRWRDVDVIIAADVDNPALGERGAAAIFAPQKGASLDDVHTLEANLSHFFEIVRRDVGVDVRDAVGAGAAGALAGGLMAFLGARIVSGVDLLLDHARFETHLQTADLVLTSEGKIDQQTLGGKGPVGLARIASASSVPTVVFAGMLDIDESELHTEGIHAVVPLADRPLTLEESLRDGEVLLQRAARRLGYLLQL